MPWSFVSLMTAARAATAVFILSAMLITLSVVAPLTAQHGPVAGLLLTAVAMSAMTAAACSAATATQLASASPPSNETESVVAPVHQGKGVSRASVSASMLEPNADLQGTWIKDFSRSDKMDQACDAMRLNGLVRQAIRLVKGVHIKLIMPPHLSAEASSEATVEQGWGEARHRQPPELIEIAVFSMLPLLKIKERYRLDGTPSNCNRRDLRRGQHRGHAVVEADGNLKLHFEWNDPHGGKGTDSLRLISQNELHVFSQIETSDGVKAQYNTVYHRSSVGRHGVQVSPDSQGS